MSRAKVIVFSTRPGAKPLGYLRAVLRQRGVLDGMLCQELGRLRAVGLCPGDVADELVAHVAQSAVWLEEIVRAELGNAAIWCGPECEGEDAEDGDDGSDGAA